MHKLKQLYILTETTLFITASLKNKQFYERSSTGHVFNNSKTIAIKKVLLLSNMFMDIVRILTLLTVKNLYRYVTNTPTSYPSKNISYFKNNKKKIFYFYWKYKPTEMFEIFFNRYFYQNLSLYVIVK